MAYYMKKRKEQNYSSGSRQFTPAMRALTDSFIVSDLGQNYTLSDLHHTVLRIPSKHISLREK